MPARQKAARQKAVNVDLDFLNEQLANNERASRTVFRAPPQHRSSGHLRRGSFVGCKSSGRRSKTPQLDATGALLQLRRMRPGALAL